MHNQVIYVTVHGSVCSFCVRLCGWTRSLCLSALPSYRAPDEVIRTVTGVARLHCLYLAGVSVVRCQIVITLVVSYSLCQSSRSGGCSRLVAFSIFPEGWRLCTAGFTAPALPMISAPPLCFGVCTCTASLSSPPLCFGVVKKRLSVFHSRLDLELSVLWQNDLTKMDPASASELRDFLSRSNSRMDHQDEQRAASNRAIQALVSQVSELTTQLQRLQTEPEQRPTASNSPAPTIPDQVGRFIEPRLPPPAFYSGEPQLCRSFLAKCSLYIKCSSNHRRFLPRNRR